MVLAAIEFRGITEILSQRDVQNTFCLRSIALIAAVSVSKLKKRIQDIE